MLLRWAATGLALACLAFSIVCWRRMGKSWRMSVTPGETTELITTGPYAYVRHPIYALSMLLMLCTLLVVPTVPVLAMAAVHITLMLMKARNEERFLSGVHGAAYEGYCRRTGRFVPPLRGGLSDAPTPQCLHAKSPEPVPAHDAALAQPAPYNPVHVRARPAALDAAAAARVRRRHGSGAGLTGLGARTPGAATSASRRARRSWSWCRSHPCPRRRRRCTLPSNRPSTAPSSAPRSSPGASSPSTTADSFHLGLTYDHLSPAATRSHALLTDIALVYLDAHAPPPAMALQAAQTYRQLLGATPAGLLRALVALPAAASNRRAFRLRLSPDGRREQRLRRCAWSRRSCGPAAARRPGA